MEEHQTRTTMLDVNGIAVLQAVCDQCGPIQSIAMAAPDAHGVMEAAQQLHVRAAERRAARDST